MIPTEIPSFRRALRLGLPILVGEAPSPGADPDPLLALTGRSGRRLAALAGLAYPIDYCRSFGRINLLQNPMPAAPGGRGSVFDHARARLAADRLVDIVGQRSFLVLLGRRVARAFDVSDACWFEWNLAMWGAESGVARAAHLAVVPHPSGTSSFWNDPTNRLRAGRFFLNLVRDVCEPRLAPPQEIAS